MVGANPMGDISFKFSLFTVSMNQQFSGQIIVQVHALFVSHLASGTKDFSGERTHQSAILSHDGLMVATEM